MLLSEERLRPKTMCYKACPLAKFIGLEELNNILMSSDITDSWCLVTAKPLNCLLGLHTYKDKETYFSKNWQCA